MGYRAHTDLDPVNGTKRMTQRLPRRPHHAVRVVEQLGRFVRVRDKVVGVWIVVRLTSNEGRGIADRKAREATLHALFRRLSQLLGIERHPITQLLSGQRGAQW